MFLVYVSRTGSSEGFKAAIPRRAHLFAARVINRIDEIGTIISGEGLDV